MLVSIDNTLHLMVRRKLREKRRSTGVVHLASTESTGGSTSGEVIFACDWSVLVT